MSHTGFLGLIQDPVVLTKTDFVLVAPLLHVGKRLGKDEVTGGRLVLGYVHLKWGPSAEGRGDIDGRLYAWLGESDGGMSGHGSLGEGDSRSSEDSVGVVVWQTRRGL
jgi:hypothetical protein